MFSSPISTPVNVFGQTDVDLAQDAELCDNGLNDKADGTVDGQNEDCSPRAEEKQRHTGGAAEEQTAEEICDNGVDDNGNGLVDNLDGLCAASVGQVHPVKSENPKCPDNGNATDCQSTNLAPIASAGNMQQVSTNESVNLNGLGSYDPDGNLTSFQWTQMGGEPSVKLQDSDTIQPTFIAPMVSNKSLLTFELKVTDNRGLTDTDYTVVSVSNTTSSNGGSITNDTNDGHQEITASSKNNQFTTKSEKSVPDTSIKSKIDIQSKKTNEADMTENVSTTFQPYRYNQLGISLEHPPDWKFASLKNGIQLIKEKDGVYVEIRKHNLESSDTNLKQYVFDDIKERSTERQDFKILNLTATTISGDLPSYKTEYSFLKTEGQKDFTTNGAANKILRFWTFANGNAYTVAYVSEKGDYDLYFPIALKIIDTLKINPVSEQSFSDNHSNNNHKSNDSNNNHKSNDSNNNHKSNDSTDKNDGGGGDKDCSDFNKKNFKTPPGDPDHLDADHDGIACEG
jgi:Excalibur calcium-binding domain